MIAHTFYVRSNMTGMFLATGRVDHPRETSRWVRSREDAAPFARWREAERFAITRLPIHARNFAVVESRGDIWTFQRARNLNLL